MRVQKIFKFIITLKTNNKNNNNDSKRILYEHFKKI